MTLLSVVRWLGVAAVVIYSATRIFLSRRRGESVWWTVFEVSFALIVWVAFALQDPT